MKLSEAIRLGSMLKPQCFEGERGHVEHLKSPGDILGLRAYDTSCAFVAALEAFPLSVKAAAGGDHVVSLRGTATSPYVLDIPTEWQKVLFQWLPCPACEVEELKLVFHLIAHLNDVHKWTRERIADWVESIERRAEADSLAQGQAAASSVAPCAPK